MVHNLRAESFLRSVTLLPVRLMHLLDPTFSGFRQATNHSPGEASQKSDGT